MTDQITITWQSLATVAGATFGAGIIVKYARQFIDMTRAASRRLAAAAGLVIVVAVTTIDTAQTAATIYDWIGILTLAGFVGMSAGLGAAKAYEIRKDGIDHSTSP